MCGIVGYVGQREASEILLNGLRRLEYRGYDSAGVAVVADNDVKVLRTVGQVKALAERVQREWADNAAERATIGIAHTRWATHGEPNECNAHPHRDQSGKIVLVHNGIIENYATLKKQLLAHGHTFASQTDTEVLAHLVGECFQGKIYDAVLQALKHVEGTYGIAVMCADNPGEIIVARSGSPLLIGIGQDEAVVASDASAIISHTRQVIYLQDGDVARVTAADVEVRNLDSIRVDREKSLIDWDDHAAEKGGFEHFMLKEIFEQPETLRLALRGRLDYRNSTAILSGLNLDPRDLASIHRAIVVGCGTSLHAGMVGKYAFESLVNIPLDIEQAAEFRYRNPIVGPDNLVLAVSQSGETADTLAAVREAKRKGALIAGICNVVGSTSARETGRGVYLHAGPEIGVASTKAFTAQVAVLLMLALKFGRTRRLSMDEGADLCKAIDAMPGLVERVLAQNDAIARIAKDIAKAQDAFFIGRGVLYPTALEGALKLKEISYIHAEGFHASELKHGPIALLDETTPVIALLNDIDGKDKTISNVLECRARKAPILGVITEGDTDAASICDWHIEVPRTATFTTPVPSIVALQLLAYHAARLRGCDIDKPKNLAKSVTVE